MVLVVRGKREELEDGSWRLRRLEGIERERVLVLARKREGRERMQDSAIVRVLKEGVVVREKGIDMDRVYDIREGHRCNTEREIEEKKG